jgi:hypothetical protein
MADAAKSGDVSNVTAELEGALSTLESALAQASRSAMVIRSNMAQITTLADTVREMETAITLARQSLSVPLAGLRVAEQPALRAVPAREQPQPAPATEPQIAAQTPVERVRTLRGELAQAGPEIAAQASVETLGGQASHCLRVAVTSKAGSLDLKAVDASVNENPAVIDVALLDYDGRQATLKLWINQSADPVGVRDALLGSLRRRLGDEGDAEVSIDFEDVA